ncbi:MAG: P-loop NTPase [Calothrix sp. FI2-JRJ7]|jgi:uncharacterized protein involved in exopolysaccharide biosynthesis/Mrp family chromosome partitioning ATPase|nr:P-loop NTPase [Calothrix sp. FI2-JRJ7]
MKKLVTTTARHWKYLLAFNLLVAIGTVAAVATSKPVWTTSTQLILPKTTSNLDASLGTLGSLKNGDPGFSAEVNPLKVQASILTSDTLLEQVLAADPDKDKFASIAKYKALFKVIPQEQSTIISLTVSGSTPELARQRAVNLIEAYQSRLNELRQANTTARQQFSRKELEQAKTKLAQVQIQIARFKKSTGLVNSEEQTKGIVGTINSLTGAKAQAIALGEASNNRAKVLSARLSLAPNQAVRSLSLGENKEYKFVQAKLSEVEATLVQKRAIFTDDHPEVKTLLAQRTQLQTQVKEYIAEAAKGVKVDTTVSTEGQGRSVLIQQLILAESEAAAQQQQAQQLDNQINLLTKTLNSLPANQAKLLELQRQLDVAEGVYKALVAQVQQNNIDAFDAYPSVQVLDSPRVDAKPISPKFFLIALNALVASVIGSLALIMLLESRNPILSPKDLQEQKFAIVERIPRIRDSVKKSELAAEVEVEFQRLASAISLQPIENRRLLVTSASVGEGKTTVAMGLAYALVDLGFKVLLVDADFHSCELTRRLGVTSNTGFERSVPVHKNLDLLPMLPQTRKIVEMIRRGGFEQTLVAYEVAGNYDYVIIDSAPVSLTSETPLMTNIIRNVLFVIRPDTSYKNSVQESFAQLHQHNANILGLVVNAAESTKKPYSYSSNNTKSNSSKYATDK